MTPVIEELSSKLFCYRCFQGNHEQIKMLYQKKNGCFSEFSKKNPKITIFRNFSEKLSSDWLFVLQWMQSPLLDTLAMCPCVVTPWHVFADVMIVLFCKHTSYGNWLLVLRLCMNSLSLDLVIILHLQISKNRLFRKSKLAKFRKLHASEKYPFYSTYKTWILSVCLSQ